MAQAASDASRSLPLYMANPHQSYLANAEDRFDHAIHVLRLHPSAINAIYVLYFKARTMIPAAYHMIDLVFSNAHYHQRKEYDDDAA